MLNKEHIVPGTILEVTGDNISLNPDLLLFEDREITAPRGALLEVLTLPRNINGINLVRVAIQDISYEVFYCDLLKKCKVPHEGGKVEP